MNWRAIGNAPGLYGPPDDEPTVDLDPFIERLTGSLAFQFEAVANHGEEVVAAFHAANPKAAFDSIVLAYATENLRRIDDREPKFRDAVKALDHYCHLFEADDRKTQQQQVAA